MANGIDFVSVSPLKGENKIGSASTQTADNNSLVFTPVSSFKWLAESEELLRRHGLYQGIAQVLIGSFDKRSALLDFVPKLIHVADHSYAIRRLDVVGHVGEVLLNLPSPEFRQIGDYYKALSLNRRALGDTAQAGVLFEAVADNASMPYRIKAMLALGSNSIASGDHKTAMWFYRELGRMMRRNDCFDAVTFSVMNRMVAVIKSIEGDHKGALAVLDAMLPAARMAASVQPHTYFDYLNARAVELCELGQLGPAKRASEIVVASSFAMAYPEWRETLDDITAKQRRASRMMIVVPKRIRSAPQAAATVESKKLITLRAHMPAAVDSLVQRREVSKGSVIDFQGWKSVLEEEPSPSLKTPSWEQRTSMTTGEKLLRLMDLISRDDTEDETIDRILEVVERIVLSRKSRD